jgi:hypothetical protein
MVNVFKLENSPERSEACHVPIYKEQGFCHPGTSFLSFTSIAPKALPGAKQASGVHLFC